MIPMVSVFTSSPLLPVTVSHLGNVQMSPEQKKQTGKIKHSFTINVIIVPY